MPQARKLTSHSALGDFGSSIVSSKVSTEVTWEVGSLDLKEQGFNTRESRYNSCSRYVKLAPPHAAWVAGRNKVMRCCTDDPCSCINSSFLVRMQVVGHGSLLYSQAQDYCTNWELLCGL